MSEQTPEERLAELIEAVDDDRPYVKLNVSTILSLIEKKRCYRDALLRIEERAADMSHTSIARLWDIGRIVRAAIAEPVKSEEAAP